MILGSTNRPHAPGAVALPLHLGVRWERTSGAREPVWMWSVSGCCILWYPQGPSASGTWRRALTHPLCFSLGSELKPLHMSSVTRSRRNLGLSQRAGAKHLILFSLQVWLGSVILYYHHLCGGQPPYLQFKMVLSATAASSALCPLAGWLGNSLLSVPHFKRGYKRGLTSDPGSTITLP